MKRALLIATLLGAATVLGFAPFHWFLLPVLTLAGVTLLWQRATRRRDAALLGFCFGFGEFLAGVSWVYVSLHDFGAMPAWLAVLLTLLLCAYLALYPAVVGLAYHALGARSAFVTLATLPALWTLAEWLRATLFTGFPWIELGYAQVPLSPLAGFVPLLGIHGATLLTAVSAALLVHAVNKRARQRWWLAGTLLLLWGGGHLLKQIEWTRPEGNPVAVSLIQGNIPQEMKWRDDEIATTLDSYHRLVTATNATLVVLPETALPLFLHQIPPDYLDDLAAHARGNHGDVLIGVPERGNATNDYYNSVVSFGSSPMQTYRKSHLVPFGEFLPLRPLFGWFLDVTQIPLGDFARGTSTPQPLTVAGERVAVNICYEDAFGTEINRQLPQATLLVNVSNVAWFGHSLAPQQHLQISQARALETGRYMLRATNTGMTAIVDQHGNVREVAPEFTTAIVTGEAQGYAGATLYVRYGDMPILTLAAALVLAAIWLALRKKDKIRG